MREVAERAGLAGSCAGEHQQRRGQAAARASSRRSCWSFATMARFWRPTCWRLRRWAGSICTRRCCPSIAGRRRFSGRCCNGESETGVTRDSHDAAAGWRADPGGRARRGSARTRRIRSWSSGWRGWASSRCRKRSSSWQSGTGRARSATPQDASLATKAPRLKKEHGAIDWSRSAEQIRNQVRALKPWPGTFTFWQRPGHEPLRMVIDRVSVLGLGVRAGVRLAGEGYATGPGRRERRQAADRGDGRRGAVDRGDRAGRKAAHDGRGVFARLSGSRGGRFGQATSQRLQILDQVA